MRPYQGFHQATEPAPRRSREAQIVKTTLYLRLPISTCIRNLQKPRSLKRHE